VREGGDSTHNSKKIYISREESEKKLLMDAAEVLRCAGWLGGTAGLAGGDRRCLTLDILFDGTRREEKHALTKIKQINK